MKRPLLSALMLSSALFLAACESAEEKAEGYYQSALSLMAEGDEERALIELRNVFDFNGQHQEARKLYADTLRARGEAEPAYRQYLLLAEQYPNTPDVRMILAEMAIEAGDLDEVERHGSAAIELVPEDPRAKAIGSLVAYQRALLANDTAGLDAARAEAEAVLEDAPDNLIARRVVISNLVRQGDIETALLEVDEVLAIDPSLFGFQVQKFQMLANLDRTEEATAQINELYRLFPENPDVRDSLVAWNRQFGDDASTEELLRRLAGAPTDARDGHVALVNFLQQTQGIPAAQAELEGLIAANEGTDNEVLYRSMDIFMTFQSGQTDTAITQMQALLDGQTSTADTRRTKILLSQMLVATQDIVGARAMVEEVLAEDSSNIDALKLRAGWRIEEDDPEGALADLRVALGQDTRNVDVLMLMARAHERAGQTERVGQRLGLAFEASASAPIPSIAYAAFLRNEGDLNAALEVLDAASTAAPTNLEVKAELAQLYMEAENWAALAELRDTLARFGTPEAEELAASIQAATLMRQNRVDDALTFLQTQAEQSDNAGSAQVVILMTQLQTGRIDEARAYLDEALAATPDDPLLRMMNATVLSMEGELDTAEAELRTLTEEFPGEQATSMLLYRLLAAQGRTDDAREVLDTARAANPGALQMAVAQASYLEQEGDFEAAIAVYEELYPNNSGNLQVANNLASLLASYSDDPEDLDRARNIGRRLGSVANPAVQDTFGWIAYRLERYDEALASLEPAAEGLPNDPLVQYHLGMTYAALERRDAAIAALTRALELGEGRELPQMETAQTTLDGLLAAE